MICRCAACGWQGVPTLVGPPNDHSRRPFRTWPHVQGSVTRDAVPQADCPRCHKSLGAPAACQ